MSLIPRSAKRAVAAPVAALLVALAVAVPLLERADFARTLVVESEHQPSSCPAGHDHTACTQVGTNHAAPSREDADQPVERGEPIGVLSEVDGFRNAPPTRGRRARAPPSA